MNQSTKQRLVGAVVLVAAVWWIVPVFLDGPADNPETISESVQLPGVESTPTQQTSIELARPLAADVAEPAEEPARPAAAEPAAVENAERVTDAGEQPGDAPADPVVEKQPADAVVEEATEAVAAAPVAEPPAPAEDAPQAPAAADGLWAVQLGSFSARENASRLAATLRSDGIAAFLTELDRDGTVLHRVRVGPVADRAAAERLVAELSSKGHSARVVQHP